MMVGLRLAHFVRRVWHFLDTEWDGAWVWWMLVDVDVADFFV